MDDLENLLSCLDSRAEVPLPNALDSRWQERIDSGHPALLDEDFPIDSAADLLTLLVNQQGKATKVALPSRAIVSAYLSGESFGWENTGIHQERGLLYTHLACQRALSKLADHISVQVRYSDWSQSTCPVCGGSPSFALLGKPDGHRMLVCGACLTEWRFGRIGCTCCDEKSPDRLQALSSDRLPGWSAYTCLSCNGYIKTADLRVLAEKPDWRKAVLSTLMLDYAVQQLLQTHQPA